jgi:hypothetical protein
MIGLQHGQLQDLVALLFAAGEAVVHAACGEDGVHLQHPHPLLELLLEVEDVHFLAALRVQCGAHEVGDGNARDLHRVLEGQKDPGAGALVRLHVQHAGAAEEDVTLRHLVRRMPGDHLGKGALAGAVGSHDRVDLSGVELQLHSTQDLRRILRDLGVQVGDLEQRFGHPLLLAGIGAPSGCTPQNRWADRRPATLTENDYS